MAKRERQKNSEDPRSQREKPENPRNIKGFYFLLCISFNNIKNYFILFYYFSLLTNLKHSTK